MHRSNERSEMASDRSQHELDHVLDHDTENATLKAQLDSLDRQLTYYHKLCREQEATIKDVRSQLEAAKAEDVARRDEHDTQMSDAAAPRDTPLDLLGETDTAKARSRKRYRAPTVELVSDARRHANSSKYRQTTFLKCFSLSSRSPTAAQTRGKRSMFVDSSHCGMSLELRCSDASRQMRWLSCTRRSKSAMLVRQQHR